MIFLYYSNYLYKKYIHVFPWMTTMALLKSFHVKRYTIFYDILQTRHYAKYMDKELKVLMVNKFCLIMVLFSWYFWQKCYNILGVSEDSDQEKIRATYLELVKRYHPDSGTSDADSNKFQEVKFNNNLIYKWNLQ